MPDSPDLLGKPEYMPNEEAKSLLLSILPRDGVETASTRVDYAPMHLVAQFAPDAAKINPDVLTDPEVVQAAIRAVDHCRHMVLYFMWTTERVIAPAKRSLRDAYLAHMDFLLRTFPITADALPDKMKDRA